MNMKMNWLVTVFAVMLAACGSDDRKDDQDTSMTEMQEEVTKQKEVIGRELNELRDKIDRQIAILSDRVDEANGETKEKLDALQRDLKDERIKVQNSINSIEDSSGEKWEDVKRTAKETLDKAKARLNELAKKVDDAFSSDQSS